MAIHAKKNGLMIAGKIISETDSAWKFQAIDNKKPTIVMKDDDKNHVFDGDDAVELAMKWMDVTW